MTAPGFTGRPSNGKPQLKPAAEMRSGAQASDSERGRVTLELTDLPSRAALAARLEAQRTELLRAMACVNLARGTIEQHLLKPPHLSIGRSPQQLEIYRQRALDALGNAHRSLATAYPMLERIAEGLNVGEILKGHASTSPRGNVAERRPAIPKNGTAPYQSPNRSNR